MTLPQDGWIWQMQLNWPMPNGQLIVLILLAAGQSRRPIIKLACPDQYRLLQLQWENSCHNHNLRECVYNLRILCDGTWMETLDASSVWQISNRLSLSEVSKKSHKVKHVRFSTIKIMTHCYASRIESNYSSIDLKKVPQFPLCRPPKQFLTDKYYCGHTQTK